MELTTLIIIVISVTISVLINYLVIRWAHDIEARKHHMVLQTQILAKIAEKQGVAKNDIEALLKKEVEPNPTRTNLFIILFLLFIVLAIFLSIILKH